MSVVQPFDGFGGEVIELVVGSLGVEPLDPSGGGQLDVVDVAPGPLASDQLVLDRGDEALAGGVVLGVAAAAYVRDQPGIA